MGREVQRLNFFIHTKIHLFRPFIDVSGHDGSYNGQLIAFWYKEKGNISDKCETIQIHYLPYPISLLCAMAHKEGIFILVSVVVFFF